ncbi:hypothetical protein [Tenacibaculum jejuense]|uniref:Uncharacterized protein n=1 Tax=Tenacibaculum jejuense TaxID=584609 RepID=A0A238UAH6_9FLAO|nr:hypothetical protein [Tenacibaculum jejuense]SNR16197.1 Probable transmembrane protein of unknown function [Tenacibaculum jejuense]
MGHRSFLFFVNKDSQEEVDFFSGTNSLLLFEANNSLPLFWLTLIDKQTLENKIKDWEAFERIDYEDHDAIDVWEENNSLEFFITKSQFNKNSTLGLDYIKRLNADYISLYQEFTHVILSNFEDNYELVIDIFQLRGFEENLADFIEPLRQQIESITHQEKNTNYFLFPEDLIVSGTGFLSHFVQEDFSLPNYEKVLRSREISRYEGESNHAVKEIYNRDLLLFFIFIVLLCPLFTYVAYRGYQKEGITMAVLMVLVLNILFYYFSLSGILRQLKAFKDLKKNKQLSVD